MPYPLDNPDMPDGDKFFLGFISKQRRNLLPEGYLAKSTNKRMVDGSAQTRKGSIMIRGNSHWFRPDNTQTFVGSFVYNSSKGTDLLILAPSSLTSGSVAVQAYNLDNDTIYNIVLPGPYTIPNNSIVSFAQGFGFLIMLISTIWTGSNAHRTNGWFWNGDTNPSGLQWTPFTWNSIDTTQVIPPSAYAWGVGNRMVYTYSYLPGTAIPAFTTSGLVKDHILLSDAWGATTEVGTFYNLDPVLQDIKINTGNNDTITTVVPYAQDTLVVFMSRSIQMMSNFGIDPTLTQVQQLSGYYGCVGIKAAIQVGTEIYFVVDKLGLMKLSAVLDQQVVQEPLPISDPIQPDIDRINWRYSSQIVLQTEDTYLYMAAPIDGSITNNAIFVFNMATGAWESIDSYNIPHFRVDNLLPIHINGVRRIVAIQNGPPSMVYLLKEGIFDQQVFDVINPRFTSVSDYMETRGYGIGKSPDSTEWATFHKGGVVLDTINPSVTITAITEGVNETKTLRSNLTRDRTKYYIHGIPDWAPGQDLAEKRQDYSINGNPPNFDAQDFEQMPLGDLAFSGQVTLPPLTIGIDPSQVWRQRFPIRMTDRWLSLGIQNTQGTCAVVATNVKMTLNRMDSRSAA